MNDRSGILPASPLILTLASVRFTSWALIAKRIDEIHDELRDELPILQHVQFMKPSASGGVEPAPIWLLVSADRSIWVHLSSEQVLLTARKYTRYSDLKDLYGRILTALVSRMKFMHVVNLGMRYVDLISASPGEGLEKYILPSWLAPQFNGATRVGGNALSAYEYDGAQLRVRFISLPGAPAVPEDMAPWLAMVSGTPTVPFSIPALEKEQALIDMDTSRAFAEPVRMDSVSDILAPLDELHSVSNRFFRSTEVTTDHAFTTWKNAK